MEVLRELALFAGIGGGILGLSPYCRTVCGVESKWYSAGVLCSRQVDGALPPFPIWDDVRTFDGRPWAGRVDIVSGGFPCQDISSAGTGRGLSGDRSGLWFEMLRVIEEVHPNFVFIENSPYLRTRGLGTVLGGLASLGFDAEWDCVSAAEVGAPHKRDRMWVLAAHPDRARVWIESWRGCREDRKSEAQSISDTDRSGKPFIPLNAEMAESSRVAPDIAGLGCDQRGNRVPLKCCPPGSPSWWAVEPDVGRVVYGLSNRVDRIEALGNAQVPRVARVAFERLITRFTGQEVYHE